MTKDPQEQFGAKQGCAVDTERENYWDHPELAADTAHAEEAWSALGQRKAESFRERLGGSEKGWEVQRKVERFRERLRDSEKG